MFIKIGNVAFLICFCISALSVHIVFAEGFDKEKTIDAAVDWGNGKAYFFKDNRYIRYDIRTDKTDPDYPKHISTANWPGVPWTDGVDAIANWGNGKAYIFRGDRYIRYDIRTDRTDPGYPKQINQANWPGVPWTFGIDAVVNWGNGKAYFFKGDQYVRYDIKTDKADSGYPKQINSSSWPGLPWSEIDTVVNWGNGKAYFLKGNQYVRYDIRADKADVGYPKPIDDRNWPGVSSLLATAPVIKNNGQHHQPSNETTSFAEKCTMVGSFTQGQTTSNFSWSVNVFQRKGRDFSLQGKSSDKYGVAQIDGRCNADTDVCQFTKSYVSGHSNGSTFYYAGQMVGDDIIGKWGLQKGQYNGGSFKAQVINCK